MQNIRIRLTRDSIDEAMREVQEYRSRIIMATRELGQALVDDGVQIAKMKISAMQAVETGKLMESVQGVFDPVSGKGMIICRALNHKGENYAAYVEYGTGIVGATNSSSEPKPSGWHHDIHNHGDMGWFYANGRWTKGQPPRPFMWETWQELCSKTNEMVRAKFNG